jgi:hypothetical protein
MEMPCEADGNEVSEVSDKQEFHPMGYIAA